MSYLKKSETTLTIPENYELNKHEKLCKFKSTMPLPYYNLLELWFDAYFFHNGDYPTIQRIYKASRFITNKIILLNELIK